MQTKPFIGGEFVDGLAGSTIPALGPCRPPKPSLAPACAPLLRLQCYEGLDEARALYEWNYATRDLSEALRRRC